MNYWSLGRTLWGFDTGLLQKLHDTHNHIFLTHSEMEIEKQTDQHATKGTEESQNNPSLQSLSTNMQSLSINMEVDKPAPKEHRETMFRVTLIRIRYFLPVCEFHLKRGDAVGQAYKYIRERFSEERFFYDQQNGHGGITIVRARSKKDESVCGVAMVEKIQLLKNAFLSY